MYCIKYKWQMIYTSLSFSIWLRKTQMFWAKRPIPLQTSESIIIMVVKSTIPYHATPYYTIYSYHNTPHHTTPYHTVPYRTTPHHTTPSYNTLSYVSHCLQHHIRHHIIYQFRTHMICVIPNHIIIYCDASHRILSHHIIARSIELLYHTPHHIIYQNSCQTESHCTMRNRNILYLIISWAVV